MQRMEEIKQQEITKEQIVLVGDCVIENIDIERYFPDLIVFNNGISGDTTIQLQESLYKRAIKYKPKKLFISIGTNDIGTDHRDVKQIYQNIMDICLELKKRTKDTEIHLVSVMTVNPANIDYINREFVDSRDNFEINMLNYYLKNFARKNKIKFIDVTKELSNNFDQLCLDYTFDGFHLNESGLSILSKLIREYV